MKKAIKKESSPFLAEGEERKGKNHLSQQQKKYAYSREGNLLSIHYTGKEVILQSEIKTMGESPVKGKIRQIGSRHRENRQKTEPTLMLKGKGKGQYRVEGGGFTKAQADEKRLPVFIPRGGLRCREKKKKHGKYQTPEKRHSRLTMVSNLETVQEHVKTKRGRLGVTVKDYCTAACLFREKHLRRKGGYTRKRLSWSLRRMSKRLKNHKNEENYLKCQRETSA